MVRELNKLSLKELYIKYDPIIQSQVTNALSRFKNISLAREDLENLLLNDIYQAIDKFDWHTPARLTVFMKVFLRNRSINHCRSMTTRKHLIINFASTHWEDVDIPMELENGFDVAFDSLTEFKENCKAITKTEHQVLDLIIEGYRTREMAKILNKTDAVISRHKSSIILKLQKYVSFNY